MEDVKKEADAMRQRVKDWDRKAKRRETWEEVARAACIVWMMACLGLAAAWTVLWRLEFVALPCAAAMAAWAVLHTLDHRREQRKRQAQTAASVVGSLVGGFMAAAAHRTLEERDFEPRCPVCNGEGRVGDDILCVACGGEGKQKGAEC